jgi:hypothetical protein
MMEFELTLAAEQRHFNVHSKVRRRPVENKLSVADEDKEKI